MSDDNVVDFTGKTMVPMEPSKVLDGAKRQELDYVLVIGSKDGRIYEASSSSDMPTALWLVEQFKVRHMVLPYFEAAMGLRKE